LIKREGVEGRRRLGDAIRSSRQESQKPMQEEEERLKVGLVLAKGIRG